MSNVPAAPLGEDEAELSVVPPLVWCVPVVVESRPWDSDWVGSLMSEERLWKREELFESMLMNKESEFIPLV